jgi:hypothetical protein
MAEVWPLPVLENMANMDSEGLLHLLDGKTEIMRVMILMTLWRIWHCRNEVIHHKPAPPIESSRHFLCNYLESVLTIKQLPTDDPAKGKTILSWKSNDRLKKKRQEEKVASQQPWRKPPERWVKLNVDGSFNRESNSGGAGIVLRDESGAILVSACAFL